jgi:chromate transporter
VRLFARLGLTAFGGPAVHVAMMETEVVGTRRWLSRAEFLDLLSVVQVLPGPNSTELAIHIGHHRAGWVGGVVAGLSFIIPSVILVWVLSMLAQTSALAPLTQSILWWLLPAMVAVLGRALWGFGRQAVSRSCAPIVMPLIALAAFLIRPELTLLLLGAAAGALVHLVTQRRARLTTLGVLVFIGASTLAAQLASGAASPSTYSVFTYFLGAGVSVFGSGYVLLAYLQSDLVDARGWLSLPALTHAAALAQITPGPLFATATSVGYHLGGHRGAAAATLGIFLPAFVSVAVSGPIRRGLAQSAIARAALDGVVVASVVLLGRAVAGFAMSLQGWQWWLSVAALVLVSTRAAMTTWVLLAAVMAGIVGRVLNFS